MAKEPLRHLTIYQSVDRRLREYAFRTHIPMCRVASEAIATWLDVMEARNREDVWDDEPTAVKAEDASPQ